MKSNEVYNKTHSHINNRGFFCLSNITNRFAGQESKFYAIKEQPILTI